MRIVDFPDGFFDSYTTPGASVVGQTISGGRALGGIERVVAGELYWTMSVQFELRTGAHKLTYASLLARLKGRSGVISMPVGCDSRTPAALPDYKLVKPVLPHSDATTFSDGQGYRSTAYHAEITGALPVRATSCTLRVTDTPVLWPYPGMVFSLLGRPVRIETVSQLDADEFFVEFIPPLREAVPAGTPAIFDGARGLFRLASDDLAVMPIEGPGPIVIEWQLVEATEPR